MTRWLQHRYFPALLLLIVTFIPFAKPLATGQTIGPWDQIASMIDPSAPKSERPWDVLQADGSLQFYVWKDLVFKSWGRHEVPVWNPYSLGGAPLLANGQSGGLYPPHILVGLLHIPTPIAVVLLAWFHLFWASLGVCSLARLLGGSKWGSVLGGAAFALSPWMLAWTPLSSVPSTVSWIPWLCAGLVGLFRSEVPYRWAGVVLLSTMSLILAGHLQFVAYGLIAGMLFGIVEMIRAKTLGEKHILRNALIAIACVGIGFVASSGQLLSVQALGKESPRINTPTEEGWKGYSSLALRQFEFPGLILPEALGNPTETMEVDGKKIGAFWPILQKQGANWAESCFGLGAVVLVALAFCHIRREPQFQFLGIISVLLTGFLLAIASNMSRLMYFWVPNWSATGSPGRAGVLFLMAACTLCGFTFSGEKNRTKVSHVAQVVFFAILVLIAFFARPAEVSLFTVVGSLVALGGFTYWTVSKKEIPAWAPLIGLIPLIICSFRVPIPMGSIPNKPFETTGRVAYENSHWSLYETPKAYFPPNLSAIYDVPEIGGYDSLITKAAKEKLRDINGGEPSPVENGNMLFIKDKAINQKLMEACVEIVYRNGKATKIKAYPYVISGFDMLSYIPHTGGKIEFDIDVTDQILVREAFHPDWRAEVDGQPVPVEAHGYWMNIAARTPGKHHVVLTMSGTPSWLRIAGVLMGLGLSFLLFRIKKR